MGFHRRRVTVIGLGVMGSSLAQAFIENGYEVTVWNRSIERSVDFESIAKVASTVTEACEASEAIVVCLVNPAACESALRHPSVETAISGKLLIQLTTSTPSASRDEAKWATRNGAKYLGGAILAAPNFVGTRLARAFYAGERDVFSQYLPWLEVLAPNSHYCGEVIGSAATMDHALLELAYGCRAVLFHCMAICEAGSVSFQDFFAQINIFANGFVENSTRGITSGIYPSGNATMTTFSSWAEQLVQTADESGVDKTLSEALLSGITRTVELGHGDADYQALFQGFIRPSARAESPLPVRD